MIFVLDNYDSFTYNIVHYLYELGADVRVARNREISVAEVLALKPDGILLSPGPGRPETAGILCPLVCACIENKIPTMGICLGHQAIGSVFGSKIIHAKEIMHGKISQVFHDGKGLFKNLTSPIRAVRYHSLAIDATTLSPDLIETAHTEDGEIMGIRHVALPIESIQYHPESILTSGGKQQIANFMEMTKCQS